MTALSLVLLLAAQPTPVPHARAAFFPRADVRLLDGPFRDAQLRDLSYLLQLDPDRLLYNFRVNAGLPTTAQPLGGWEAPGVELRGHTLGHYLTACSLMYEDTGDERLKARVIAITAALSEVQRALQAHGSNPGYLSAFPESFFDRLEARQDVWAPYYTIHKILAGLLDVHRVTGDPTALKLATGIAHWVGFRASRLSPEQWQAMLETEFGGMEESLTRLYWRTGDHEYLRLARLFDHHAVFDPLARGEDDLDGLHANTQIPKAIGAALDCDLTTDPRYCKIAKTFWERVAHHRSYVIGGNSDYEYFFPIAHFSRYIGIKTAETCNTYNMLKLTRLLFELDAAPARMDFYERALFNHILSSQDPATGMVIYHFPLKPGAWRTYSTPNDSFWCCVGTGMENPTRYGDAIYAHEGDDLLVNLFIASTLAWHERGLTLRQETRFPDEDHTRLVLGLEKPGHFALSVRYPAWAGALSVAVNGQAQTVAGEPGSYVKIEREWHDGDTVEVTLPMSLRVEAMPDDPSVVAFLYGPMVLAADLGVKGLDSAKIYGLQAPEMKIEDTPPIPVLVADSVKNALARIKPGTAPLTFHTEGLGHPTDVDLVPVFRLPHDRFTVYFDLFNNVGWAEHLAHAGDEVKAEAALDRRTIDHVTPGLPEDEARHEMQQKNTEDTRFEGRRNRRAFWGGGHFSYELEVPPAEPVVLGFTCWGGETRRQNFEVTIDGEVLATKSLFDDRPGQVLPIEVLIPQRLTQGKDHVRVGFRPTPPHGSVGAIFDVRTLRPE